MASRRQFFWLAAGGAVMSASVSGYLRNRAIPLETRPITGLPGFSYLEAGPRTGGLPDPFFGLDAAETPAGSLEDLFDGTPAPGVVPVASFSDYNCAYCRVLTKMLPEIDGIDITWHELPLLGARSVMAAKVAIAADMQGAYMPMHARLMRSGYRIDAAWLHRAADELGLDGARLVADMEGPEVADRLERSAGVAALFGIYGTPALVVGHVLVLGNIDRADLNRLIEQERLG
ncbi:DsbA family protein [Tropicimonas sp. IMCC6043]|uniref:DsbA family protein n=1 Tax=Tropicimonas sp. IMCC6043 TaxID=2510645 RepID=UPI00101D528F|nr:DsbA family protein [Tropicimonas sp. IMCC6043]RYH10926.1 hypothetical protein EU800_06650 [Tropicimonas sp. IMCC6043]